MRDRLGRPELCTLTPENRSYLSRSGQSRKRSVWMSRHTRKRDHMSHCTTKPTWCAPGEDRSAWTSTQSDQSTALNRWLRGQCFFMRTAKTHIRGLSESSLGTQAILLVMLRLLYGAIQWGQISDSLFEASSSSLYCVSEQGRLWQDARMRRLVWAFTVRLRGKLRYLFHMALLNFVWSAWSEPCYEKTCLQRFATSKDSNQFVQLQKLARELAFWTSSYYPAVGQQMEWSDCTDAQACQCFVVLIWTRSCKNVSYAICEQQRCRSACASAQSDQHLCCSLLR